MWNLPGPGIEPVSPALAGDFLTTGPPGKSKMLYMSSFIKLIYLTHVTTLPPSLYLFIFFHLHFIAEESEAWKSYGNLT